MRNLSLKLLIFEIRKMWTVPILIISGIFTIFGWAGLLLPIIFGAMKPGGIINELDIAQIISGEFKMLVPLLSIFFGAGIISFDMKNGWLRTLMARPVTKAEYVFTKIISATISIFALLLLMGTLPVLIISMFMSIHITFDIWIILAIHILSIFQTMTYIIICIWFSCWLPGFLNIFVLAVWMIVDSISAPIISSFLWDNNLALIISDFMYPSGFREAIESIAGRSSFPTENILWGLASLSGFLTLALFHFSKIQIDKGGE
jgi:ABC-type transport system involved in multi-copper enzyme maturation permease subunit